MSLTKVKNYLTRYSSTNMKDLEKIDKLLKYDERYYNGQFFKHAGWEYNISSYNYRHLKNDRVIGKNQDIVLSVRN